MCIDKARSLTRKYLFNTRSRQLNWWNYKLIRVCLCCSCIVLLDAYFKRPHLLESIVPSTLAVDVVFCIRILILVSINYGRVVLRNLWAVSANNTSGIHYLSLARNSSRSGLVNSLHSVVQSGVEHLARLF